MPAFLEVREQPIGQSQQVSGVFVADAEGTEANILLYGELSSVKNVTNGDTFSFASGDLDIFFK